MILIILKYYFFF